MFQNKQHTQIISKDNTLRKAKNMVVTIDKLTFFFRPIDVSIHPDGAGAVTHFDSS